MDSTVGYCGGVVRKRTKRLPGRNWKLQSSFRVSEIVVISLFLLSHYSSSVSVAGEFLKRLVSLSSKPLHAFFISNIIILAIAVLSGVDADSLRIGRGKKARGGVFVDGIYDEYVARCRAIVGRGNDLEVSLEAGDIQEVEKQIVLFSSPTTSVEGGKGSPSAAATATACNRCTKDGYLREGTKAERSMDIASPRGRGRLVLHGVVGGHAPGEPAAVARDGSMNNSNPEKFTQEAKPHRMERLTLPDIIVPWDATSDSTAEKRVILKSLSKASSNRQKALPTKAIAVRHGELKNSTRQREIEAERSRDIPSPRGRGRLVAVRGNGVRTVDDMSNEEFNQNVEKYIAKTRRFLQEESMREINLGNLYRDRSAGPRSF